MNDPLVGIYSAFINLLVIKLRKIGIESIIVREPTKKVGTKQKDGKLFDGLIGLVQQDVRKINLLVP